MVKIFIAGLLAADGVNAASVMSNTNSSPRPFLRQDPDCCKNIKISGSESDADGNYSFKELGQGNRYIYERSDGMYFCHYESGFTWMCQDRDLYDSDDHAVGVVAIVDSDSCMINKKVSDKRWQVSKLWPDKVNEYFKISKTVRIECTSEIDECINNADQCPDNSQCRDTAGGYECDCDEGKTCEDWDQCGDNGGASCPADSACLEADDGYTCDCDAGYSFNSTTTLCEDQNECDQGDMCSEIPLTYCNNIPGDYECACINGYFKNDDGDCEDEDECDEVDFCINDVNSHCVNKDGGASCKCNAGYVPNPSVGTCEDVKECDNDDTCTDDQTCVELPGTHRCDCKAGYNTNDDGTCADKDECDLDDNLCQSNDNAECVNTSGSYACVCKSGYEQDPEQAVDMYGVQCTNEDECTNNKDENGTVISPCEDNQTCKDIEGSFECPCNAGFEDNEGVCSDIDECADAGKCVGSNTECNNSDGAHSCDCLSGFELSQDGENCTEINECATTDCAANQVGTDRLGYCECNCESGWAMGDNDECDDINECDTGDKVCDMFDNNKCENSQGGASCVCADGYDDQDSDGDCEDINECAEGAPAYCTTPNTRCVNSAGRAGCACLKGFTSKPGGAGCEDKNECDLGTHNCPANSSCDNKDGTFECPCDVGFRKDSLDNVCINIDDCYNNESCGDNQHCVDGVNDFSCECNTGWSMNVTSSECIDVDQCANGEVVCSGLNEQCWPDEGEDSCNCAFGWSKDNNATSPTFNVCNVNVDECAKGYHNCDNDANSYCVDNAGSYSCDCNSGFEKNDEGVCQNVNECDNGHVCESPFTQCVDQQGGVGCECIDGYWEVNQTCTDRNECEDGIGENNDVVCDFEFSSCTNKDKSYECGCQPGYAMNETHGAQCNNVDECGGEHGCPDNEYCFDTSGSHECRCLTPAWEGESGNCTDVDECETGAQACDADAKEECRNYDGGAECICISGYEPNVNGTCVDVDDCSNGNMSCGENENCVNEEGSARCDCNPGYEKQLNEHGNVTVCGDINECSGNHDCHELASCVNTEGDYTCKCPGEYQGDGRNCIMCPSEECWTYDANTMTCTPKDHCSTLKCGGEGLEISMMIELFGLNAGEAVNWAGSAEPECVDDKCAINSAFGTDGMTYSMTNDTITFSMMISLAGADRHRSDVEHDSIDLGDRQIVINPFGVGMIFQCTYPLLVTLSSEAYTVEDVSISSSMQGHGKWTDSFTMVLNGGDGVEFILGEVLPVAISWAVNHNDLTFYYDGCSVTHGNTMINVIKGGCYAGATKAMPTVDEKNEKGFEFQIFKGVNEMATSQTIECSVMICKIGECGNPKSNDDCPSDGIHDSFYGYTYNGGE